MTEEYQCPTCGRIQEDWGNADTKALAITLNKGKQREESEDRTADYRAWRWNIGSGCYVSDIDHIEYRISNGIIKPVALLELTRVDGDRPIPDTYLNAILNRFKKRDAQYNLITHAAKELDCKAWVVLFREDLNEFWLYNLTNNRGWYKNLAKDKYKRWLLDGCGINR